MTNITITNVDLGSVVLENGEFRDELLTFPGTDTYVEGTLLARRADALVPTASAITGTGNGTLTALSVVEGPIVPLVGAYLLTCIATVTNGGRWKLEDPNGALVADDLEMTVGAGAASVFEVGGLKFTLTDGSTDFVAGATFTITVAADGKLVVYAIGGAGGAQVPVAVLTYEVSRTGAGDVPVRIMRGGKVRKERLVVDADGNATNITNAILDQLQRNSNTIAVSTKQLSVLDNQ